MVRVDLRDRDRSKGFQTVSRGEHTVPLIHHHPSHVLTQRLLGCPAGAGGPLPTCSLDAAKRLLWGAIFMGNDRTAAHASQRP